MGHVSRIHRVALDWLFDRIKMDSKTQIKYVDTKNQLADILSDEWWVQPSSFFMIMNVPMFACGHLEQKAEYHV